MTSFTATYSPEDNKLRLYASNKLATDDYNQVKAAGFRWAPKQELFVAPAWTPEREDLLLALAGEIDDEDTSLVDRAEDRAERFDDYSAARLRDAESAKATVDTIAQAIPFGQPILVGHHSERHARKDAERIQNGMRKAVNLWKTSKYWQERAAGALHHAKYKERPDVRARRIKTIEADLRKSIRASNEARCSLEAWSIHNLTHDEAVKTANYFSVSQCFSLAEYPRDLPASQYEGMMSLWDALGDHIITAAQAAEIAIRVYSASIERQIRWIEHDNNRLTYERAMLGESGGIATDKTGPEKGGACRCWASPGFGKGWSYIKRVNKVSVTVEDNWGNDGRNFTRTISFDKLTAVMSKADVDAARADGRIHDCTTGFYLDLPAETRDDAKERVHSAAVQAARTDTAFQALEQQSKKDIVIVAAPQLFPTPPELAAEMIAIAGIETGHRILEPSAGTGNLLAAIGQAAPACQPIAVEINAALADRLRATFTNADIRCADFLDCNGDLGTFDRIVMNPPFGNGSDIQHIMHARKLLKPGGRLVALCANGPRQRDKLLPIVELSGGDWVDLPAGSFAESGTNVNAALLTIEN